MAKIMSTRKLSIKEALAEEVFQEIDGILDKVETVSTKVQEAASILDQSSLNLTENIKNFNQAAKTDLENFAEQTAEAAILRIMNKHRLFVQRRSFAERISEAILLAVTSSIMTVIILKLSGLLI
jgi:hypothetical protein